MRQLDNWKFGFFFISSSTIDSSMYFAGFQEGESTGNAHQIVIAEVCGTPITSRKVAYALDPLAIELLEVEKPELETLCRIAVAQFLAKLPAYNLLCQVLPLDLSGMPWDGKIQAVERNSD